MSSLILLPIFLPVISGAGMLISSAVSKWKERPELGPSGLKKLHILTVAVLLVSAIAAVCTAWSGDRSLTLFYLMKDLPIYFHIDDIGRLFVTLISIIWVAISIYSFVYMKHEGEERRFFGY